MDKLIPSHPHLFQPIQLGKAQSKNRIEVAPAAPYLTGHDGSLSPEFYAYLKNLASSGAGVVTLGVTPVDPGRLIGSRNMNLGNEMFLPDFNEIAELMHSFDALACAETVYVKYMLSPADKVVNETSTADVEEMISRFVEGIDRLQRAGFDMALIHGGHGNVPAMFFNAANNKRTDRFGGSFEGRCQFAVELLQAVREKCGDRIALEYRVSAEEMTDDGTTLEETIEFAKVIEPYIDLLHVSRGLLERDELVPYINAPLYLPKAMNLPYAKKIKQTIDIPVTVVGSFDLDLAEQAIADGDVDMVSMIRTIYADSSCVEKSRIGDAADIRPCIRCNTCIDRTHTHHVSVRCAVNPLIGRESRFPALSESAPSCSRGIAAVIGGGPSGMQAALTLAQRGFIVKLYEAESELGGQLKLADSGTLKQEIKAYLSWLTKAVTDKPAIEVLLNTTASVADIEAISPEAVFVACGSSPIIPDLIENPGTPIYWFGDAESGVCDPGETIVIAGAGMTGMEYALLAARQGRNVHLVDMCPYERLGQGASTINVRCLKGLLEEEGVSFHCEQILVGTDEKGAIIRAADGAEKHIPCDSVVLSLGFRPNTEIAEQFETVFPKCYRIGDCSGRGGSIFHAIGTAFEKAMQA